MVEITEILILQEILNYPDKYDKSKKIFSSNVFKNDSSVGY